MKERLKLIKLQIVEKRTSIKFMPGFKLRISLRTLNLLASGKDTSLRSTRAGLAASAGLAYK